MANTKSALKAWRQNLRRRVRNRPARRSIRTQINKAHIALDHALRDTTAETVLAAVQALDKAAEKRIIHRNNAARRKSRLMKRLNKLQAAKVA